MNFATLFCAAANHNRHRIQLLSCSQHNGHPIQPQQLTQSKSKTISEIKENLPLTFWSIKRKSGIWRFHRFYASSCDFSQQQSKFEMQEELHICSQYYSLRHQLYISLQSKSNIAFIVSHCQGSNFWCIHSFFPSSVRWLLTSVMWIFTSQAEDSASAHCLPEPVNRTPKGICESQQPSI